MKCCEFTLDSGKFVTSYCANPSVILRFGRKMTVRCGEPGRGSDSPPGCHSLPRLRFAYPLHRGAFGAVQTRCFKRNFAEFHTPSKASDRSRGPKDVLCPAQCVTNCPRRLAAKLQGTSKNSPFVIWENLCPQLFIAKIPQYTKYSGISATHFAYKSLAQIIKKEFLEVAYNLSFSCGAVLAPDG